MTQTFVVVYRPLCSTAHGRAVTEDPPFVDGSCRREPDLESKYPSITALCRGRNFAPRLAEGDRVAYVTAAVRGTWRLTAMLEVMHRFKSHREAAAWYRRRDLPLPSNCIVDGNPPIPLRRTLGTGGCGTLKEWDFHYRARARKIGVFLVCRAFWKDLRTPPIITRANWNEWNGAPTRTPKDTPHLWDPLWAARSQSSAPRDRVTAKPPKGSHDLP